jgi:glycosyltransferase involved in cell wall biosynthesis
MKILLLSPNQIHRYNWGHQLFRNEIGKHLDVFYYGEGFPNFDKNLNVSDIIKIYGPFDVLLTYGLRYTLPFQGIVDVKIPKFHIVIDLFPPHKGGYKGGMYTTYKKFVETNKYDGFFYRQRCQSDYLKKIGCVVPTFWLPFSVDIEVYKKLNLPKEFDVLTSSSQRKDVYPNRVAINRLVNKMKLKSIQKKVVHEKYINSINQSKICIISTNVFHSPNMKFTEFTSCGSFVLSDKPEDFDELGFKDNYHLVIYKDLKDLEDKIKYYLKNEKEREIIAKNGMNFVRRNHNNTVRSKFLIDTIERFIK